ncbi:MAG: response regulator [Eubacteriales bacterium]|nr:response regulator [Eubacteriales bacterium]
MLKVLIADDEIKVCRLIQCLIDWKSLGMEIVGVADDGMNAYQIIQKELPDIVITDIRMPGYDGLELIKNAKELKEDICFIIISGYSQFDYAKRAIQYGVSDYILKPIRKKELEHTLKTILMKKNDKEIQVLEKEAIITQLSSTERKLKGHLINELLLAPGKSADFSTMDELNQEYCTDFHAPYFQLVCIQPIMGKEYSNIPVSNFLLAKIKDLLSESFSSFCEISIATVDGQVFCLLNGNEKDFQNLKRTIKKIKNSLLTLRDVFPDLNTIIALSSMKNHFQEIGECIYEVRDAMLEKIIYGSNSVIDYSKISKGNLSCDAFVDASFRKELMLNIETFNTEGIQELIQQLSQRLASAPGISGKFTYLIFKDLVDTYFYGTKHFGIQADKEQLQEQILENFSDFCSVEEAFRFLSKEFIRFLKEWQDKKQNQDSKPIRTAKQYMHEHYYEPLTLEILGEVTELNPSYFSSLFKKETGTSFIEYLTDIRIQNAKQLLITTSYGIIDISEEVGINNLKYFTKLFKKATGLTPTDYRKLFS